MLKRDKDKLFRPKYDKENGCWVDTKSSLNHRGHYIGYSSKTCQYPVCKGEYDEEGRKCGHWVEPSRQIMGKEYRVETWYVEGKPAEQKCRSYKTNYLGYGNDYVLDDVLYYEDGRLVRKEEYDCEYIPSDWEIGWDGFKNVYRRTPDKLVQRVTNVYTYPMVEGESENTDTSAESKPKTQTKKQGNNKFSRLLKLGLFEKTR